MRPALTPCFLLSAVVTLAATVSEPAHAQDPDSLTAAIRPQMESLYQEGYGVGFASFGCRPVGKHDDEAFVECEGVDAEDDRFQILLSTNDSQELELRMITFSASVIPEDLRSSVEGPCLRFLDSFRKAGWSDLWDDLDPALQKAISADAVAEQLADLQQELGEIDSARALTVSHREDGRLELQYVLPTETATARFRCKVRADEPRIIGYLFDLAPGSEVHDRRLAAQIAAELSTIVHREVESVEVPVTPLELLGDTVESQARLASGQEFAIQIERTSRIDDFHPLDYTFRVLDIPLLFSAYLEGQGTTVRSISCPRRSVPDGSELTCTVIVDDDEHRTLRVRRQGGDFRLLRFDEES